MVFHLQFINEAPINALEEDSTITELEDCLKIKILGLMIVFFDIRGILYINWVSEGQTVNKDCYLETLAPLREQVSRKHLNCGETNRGFPIMTTRHPTRHWISRRIKHGISIGAFSLLI